MSGDMWGRDLTVLEAIADLEQEHGNAERIDTIVEATGLERREVVLAVRALHEDEFITGIDARTLDDTLDTEEWLSLRLRGKGRRAVRQWPPEDAGSALIAILRAQLDEETDPERREGLERMLDGAQTVGTTAAGMILHTVWRSLAGM